MASLTPSRSLSDIAVAPFTGILNLFDAVMDAHKVSQEAQRLFNMTDAQLEEEGLSRDEVPAHLMRSMPKI